MSRGIRFVTESKRRLTLFGVLVVALAAGMGAFAYFSSIGSGTGSASAGTLAAPTNVSGSASGSTVIVSWSAPTGGTVSPSGYYVTRSDGINSVAACGSSAASPLPASPTHCNDTGVPSGIYTYTVVAVYRTWTATSGPSPPVTVAPLDHFQISAPASTTAGSAFSVTVTAKDASNNTVSTYTGTIHFTSSDGQAVLPSDYQFTGGDGGSHTFSGGVTLKTAGTQSVSVNDTVQTSATGSFSVSVSAAGATKLAFTQQPSNSTGGVAFPTQPKVAIEDAFGNVVTSDSSTVTLSIAAGTPTSGGPGTLSGCSQSESSGIVNFSGCKIDTAGTGYKLHAADGSLTAADSNAFNITPGPAAKLVFTQQPSNSTGGVSFPTQPKVAVQDAFGNVVTSDSSTVTLSLAAGTPTSGGPGTLSGCSQSESGGIVSFSGCTINTVGTAYKLHATDGSLTAADSSAFNVTLGPAAQLAFTQQPSNSTAAVAFPTQPKVTVQDAGGNTETGDNATTVTVAIGTNPGSGTLSGTKTVTVASGVATFSGLSIDKSGNGYTLSATSSPAHGSATSSTFNITLGAATKFNLSASSASITAGNTTDLTITAVDAGGNTVTSYTGSHNLIFSGASSSPSGTTPTVTNASGAAVNFGTTTPISFTNGVAQVSGGTNGRATLYKAETASISATEGSMTTQTPASVTVSAGSAARLAWTHVTVSAGTLSSPCLFACTDTGLGNNGTFTANVSVTDSLGNTVSGLGNGHTVSVSTPTSGSGSGGSFTAPTSGTTVNLTISATGPADSTQQFTFKTQNSGTFTETFSTQTTAGTSYTSATASVTRQ